MANNEKKYSVLMSVYEKETPSFLRQSMDSIYNQTVPTDDFVLICDGKLTDGLYVVIDEMKKKFGSRLRVINRERNVGLGSTLNFGINECKNKIIARMDSDDVSVRDRCEKELEILDKNPEISVVGSFVAEFETSPDELKSIRKVPETQEEILKFVKIRSPMNHPSVMYRKEDVIAAGNYRNVRFCQDYYLWAKMLAKGYKLYNIQEPLVLMRENKNSFKRRSGKEYFKIQKQLFQEMRRDGLLNTSEYYGAVAVRFCSAMAPNWMRKALFKRFMRVEIK